MSFVTIPKRRDFLAAAAGKKFITHSFILQMAKRNAEHPAPSEAARIGFTVTKKIGGAVVRNRVKRRLREAVRPILAKYGEPGHDYVLIARHKAIACDFSELVRDMEFAFSRIIHHKGSTPKTDSETT